jgi:hypothetical protein
MGGRPAGLVGASAFRYRRASISRCITRIVLPNAKGYNSILVSMAHPPCRPDAPAAASVDRYVTDAVVATVPAPLD